MVVWRGQMRWIGSLFQHFKVQLSKLLLCDGTRVWGGIVLEKQHPFLQPPLPFSDQCLFYFVQERCIVVWCDSCTLHEVVNQQYPIFVPRNRCHQLGDWLLCWTLFGWGKPLYLHYLDHSFVSWSYKYTQISTIVTCKAKKPAVVCLKYKNVKPQHNHASDPHSNI